MARKRKASTSRPKDEPTPRVESPVEDAPAERDDDTAANIEAAENAGGEEAATREISRDEFLARMAEKNELNAALTRRNHELEAKLDEANDKWLRSVAEFENYRKRTRKEWELLKQQSRAEVILEILAIVDDFERAFAAVEESDSSGVVEGFRLIHNNFIQALGRLGVRELDSLHQPFDPNYHMAVGQIERDDLDVGVVAEVVQKGYALNDVVIRPANVLVAK